MVKFTFIFKPQFTPVMLEWVNTFQLGTRMWSQSGNQCLSVDVSSDYANSRFTEIVESFRDITKDGIWHRVTGPRP